MDVIVADIGGTHARFAYARVAAGQVLAVDPPRVFPTAGYPSLEAAWQAFVEEAPRPSGVTQAALAIAGPVQGDVLQMTNSPWQIRPQGLAQRLGLRRLHLLNDFGAVAHAVTRMGGESFQSLAGPGAGLPPEGVISVLGPGTGLGVAQILRRQGREEIIETEGGHIGFAPQDEFEDTLLQRLRRTHGRVSAERVASGPALAAIHALLLERSSGVPGVTAYPDDPALWQAALSGRDSLAAAALSHFCACLGSVAGDIALAHGAAAVVIGGGLGRRLAAHLPRSPFIERLVSKGRFERVLRQLPVALISHPEPGLYGAAVVCARHPDA